MPNWTSRNVIRSASAIDSFAASIRIAARAVSPTSASVRKRTEVAPGVELVSVGVLAGLRDRWLGVR